MNPNEVRVEMVDDSEQWTYKDALVKSFAMARAIGSASDWALLANALFQTRSAIVRESGGAVVVVEEPSR